MNSEEIFSQSIMYYLTQSVQLVVSIENNTIVVNTESLFNLGRALQSCIPYYALEISHFLV